MPDPHDVLPLSTRVHRRPTFRIRLVGLVGRRGTLLEGEIDTVFVQPLPSFVDGLRLSRTSLARARPLSQQRALLQTREREGWSCAENVGCRGKYQTRRSRPQSETLSSSAAVLLLCPRYIFSWPSIPFKRRRNPTPWSLRSLLTHPPRHSNVRLHQVLRSCQEISLPPVIRRPFPGPVPSPPRLEFSFLVACCLVGFGTPSVRPLDCTVWTDCSSAQHRLQSARRLGTLAHSSSPPCLPFC